MRAPSPKPSSPDPAAPLAGSDGVFLRRALALARRGDGAASPNPLVGAVLVRHGRIVGEGWHGRFGGPHAEAAALAQAGRRARGATLYVTLEPCNHHGKTPPCTEAILRAGVARVVASMRDPNRGVTGGGLARLASESVVVEVGTLEAEAERLNESFLKHVRTGLPLVRWKCAASLDGRIATAAGESRWITSAPARRWGHALRRWADAILVGISTAIADDPELTVRAGRPKRVARVVLDRRARLAPGARLLAADGAPVVVFTTVAAPARRRRALEAAGAEVVVVPGDASGRPRVRSVLRSLGARGIGRLLVEGGGEVAASFWRERLVDRVSLALGPALLGSDARPAVGPLAITRLRLAPRLAIERVRRLGPDVLIEARPLPASRARRS